MVPARVTGHILSCSPGLEIPPEGLYQYPIVEVAEQMSCVFSVEAGYRIFTRIALLYQSGPCSTNSVAILKVCLFAPQRSWEEKSMNKNGVDPMSLTGG